jgi:lipopolysaccharide assembly protein A
MSTEPQPATQTPAPDPAAIPQQPVSLPQHKIRHTRVSGLWFAVGFFALLLLFLLIFILQNSSKVDISFLGAHGHIPLGVALLFSAVCGALLAVLAGVARMTQLRSVARRHRKVDARRTTPASAPPATASAVAAPPASTPADPGN